jgi:hypothetical protein
MAVRREGDVEHRLRVGLDLQDLRLVDLGRQPAPHPAHPVAHVVGGGFDVAAKLETDGYLAALLPRGRAQEVDAFDAGDRFLQHARDGALDHLRAGAAVVGLHQHHRRIDARIFANRQPAEGHQPDQHHDEAEHGRKHRTADAKVGQLHVSSPCELGWPIHPEA